MRRISVSQEKLQPEHQSWISFQLSKVQLRLIKFQFSEEIKIKLELLITIQDFIFTLSAPLTMIFVSIARRSHRHVILITHLLNETSYDEEKTLSKLPFESGRN